MKTLEEYKEGDAMTIREKLIGCLLNIGIVVDETEEDIDLKEYIVDSLQFISTVIEIERVFLIEFPDELLTYSVFDSLNGLANIIQTLQEGNNEIDIYDEIILKGGEQE